MRIVICLMMVLVAYGAGSALAQSVGTTEAPGASAAALTHLHLSAEGAVSEPPDVLVAISPRKRRRHRLPRRSAR